MDSMMQVSKNTFLGTHHAIFPKTKPSIFLMNPTYNLVK
jgi:hypothetical protein